MTFKANSKNIEAFLKGPAVRAMIESTTGAVAGRAGDGFSGRVTQGRDRVRGAVSATTADARLRQARDHVIERAVGGG